MPLLRALGKNLFAPPYRLLPLAVFVFFALCFALHPASPLHTHQLFDPDDTMRLNQLVNWLLSDHPFGAGWFDFSHPRLDPGGHVILHWSRLVDLPLAVFAWPFVSALGAANAALIASFIVPPLLFALLLVILPALARPVVGRARANLAAVVVLFLPYVMLNYLPGRADHHGYQIIVATFGLLCLERMFFCPRGWKASTAAAIVFAGGLWIGTEALPWLALFCACVALVASWRGGFALRNAAVFGMALLIAVAIVTPLAVPPAEYFSRTLSWFSSADLIFALLAGAVFIAAFGIGGKIVKPALRLGATAIFGLIAATAFILLDPEFFQPFVHYEKANTALSFGNIGEAEPFWKMLPGDRDNPVTFFYAVLMCLQTMFLPALGLGVIGWNMFRGGRRAQLWLMHGFFLLPALLLTLFWQMRVGWFAETFSVAPVTWLLWRGWRWVNAQRFPSRLRFWAEIAVFVILIPLPVVLLPDAVGHSKIYPDVLLFPAVRGKTICPLQRASTFLHANYGNRRTILAAANDGPDLLFRTHDNVLAAPYNVPGNKDVFDFFNARVDQQAMEIALRRGVDLVLVCRSYPLFYADEGDTLDAAAQTRVTNGNNQPVLIERLATGEAPDWLIPVVIPLDPDYLLFEVRK